jgi:type VI secretion system protein VasG
MSRGHYEITPEHLLSVFIDQPNGDVQTICKHYGIDPARLQRQVQTTLDSCRSGNPARPVFSPLLGEWLSRGWMVASLELGLTDIRSGALFAAMVQASDKLCAGDYADLFGPISANELIAKLDGHVKGSAGLVGLFKHP